MDQCRLFSFSFSPFYNIMLIESRFTSSPVNSSSYVRKVSSICKTGAVTVNTPFTRSSVSDSGVAMSASLKDTLLDYCIENGYQCEECQSLDLDNDGTKDYIDKDTLESGSREIAIAPIIGGIAGALLLLGAAIFLFKRKKRTEIQAN